MTETKLKSQAINDDAVTLAKIADEAWTAFTPSWGGITVGNGTSLGAYKRINNTVLYRASFEFGSTSSIVSLGLAFPITINSGYSTYAPIGTCSLNDNGGLIYLAIHYKDSGIYIQSANATYVAHSGVSSTVPFTWGTGDRIAVGGFYEAA